MKTAFLDLNVKIIKMAYENKVRNRIKATDKGISQFMAEKLVVTDFVDDATISIQQGNQVVTCDVGSLPKLIELLVHRLDKKDRSWSYLWDDFKFSKSHNAFAGLREGATSLTEFAKDKYLIVKRK